MQGYLIWGVLFRLCWVCSGASWFTLPLTIFSTTPKTRGLMEGLRQYDQPTWWVIVILVNVIFIVLHISMFNKSLQTLDFKKIFKKKRKNIYQESGGESPQPQNRTYEENYTPVQQPDPEVSSFFNGCDTPEKPDKRYKSLAKAFQPDTEAGDNESMQKLNAEYERLKSKFTDNAD